MKMKQKEGKGFLIAGIVSLVITAVFFEGFEAGASFVFTGRNWDYRICQWRLNKQHEKIDLTYRHHL